MPRLIVKNQNGLAVLSTDLEPKRAIVLGRTPDSSVAESVVGEDRALDARAVSDPYVSGNHAAVWIEAGTANVRDLGSRNGTWLLLPKNQTVRVDASEVELLLAQTFGGTPASDQPRPPTWSSSREYAAAVADSIQQWIEAHGIEARTVVVSAADGAGNRAPTRIPLASGVSIDIVPLRTTDAAWSRLLESLWRWTAQQDAVFEAEEETRREGMILASASIRATHRDAVDAAKQGAPTLLLTGPSGAGKEMLAEVFHRHSGRSGPFIPVNCSMLSKDLLRSELFGAEAGSFTGASRRIVGAVERAEGGTLFLDEIGEIPNDVQAMLLRFLDRREYDHVGQYGRVQRADVRVVAATNRDLRELARTGAFRADLWFRLSVYQVDVPALRGRWEDIAAYLENVRTDDGRSLLEALPADVLGLLRAHPWEGNFRELRSFAERLSHRTGPGPIDEATCRHELKRGALSTAPPPTPASAASPADWESIVARAIRAFTEDRGRAPTSWDDQKEWNEKYLKPLLFFHLSGASGHPVPTDDDALKSLSSKLALLVQADRGTAYRQLERYFERFGR